MHVSVGMAAPEFTLRDHTGSAWSLKEQLGSPVVLYFYPKDGTAGCTEQACSVRDQWQQLLATGAVVAGISPDSAETHARFAATHHLPQTLLADTERTVIRRYGAVKTKPDGSQGVRRSSVVIAADGLVRAVFDDIASHEQAKRALQALAADSGVKVRDQRGIGLR